MPENYNCELPILQPAVGRRHRGTYLRAITAVSLVLSVWVFLIAGSAVGANEWTWMHGANGTDEYPSYGTQGIFSPDNLPGNIVQAMSWTDSNGDLWLFGGLGVMNSQSGNLNDLWKFERSRGEWIWVKGNGVVNTHGNYGVKGVAAATNSPGSRVNAVTWTDPAGNFWLYGGSGYSESNSGILDDLWKYDPASNMWTWVDGSKSTSQNGVYGTQGVPSSANTPGGRMEAVGWVDADGNFWLFGGRGPVASSGVSDLWKYEPQTGNWTWMGGSGSYMAQSGQYGTQGVPDETNWPGSRFTSVTWTDDNGNFWLFGGFGAGETGFGPLNDLWKYNPSTGNWTWIKGSKMPNQQQDVYGTQGVGSAGNTPGARMLPLVWTGSGNTLWLFGGGRGDSALADLWRFDVTNENWVWIGGSTTANYAGNYLTQGSSTAGSSPASHFGAVTWADNAGNFWFFGGRSRIWSSTSNSQMMNDLWKYEPDLDRWTWVRGSCKPQPGGVGGGPTTRHSSMTWSDQDGNLWLFGGKYSSSTSVLGDVWKYNLISDTWTFVYSSGPAWPTYGVKGVPAATNAPGVRANAASWSDAAGNLWIFGGFNAKLRSDVWKYDISSGYWTWMSGGNDTDNMGQYGMLGVSNAASCPGPREGAVTWKDSDGNFWLFGGYGNGSSSTGKLNDLWKLEPGSGIWTWMAGSKFTDQSAVYGEKGIAGAGNIPGGRSEAVSWVDSQGHFWLFGGSGYAESANGVLNDLWKFDPTSGHWTWVDGSKTPNSHGVYGTSGIPGAGQMPGARADSVSWTDGRGDLWLFGGNGYGQSAAGLLNDVWKYNLSTGLWTWIKGSNEPGKNGYHGTEGISTPEGTPGARDRTAAWTDSNNNFWLFGTPTLNDLWKFTPGTTSGISWTESIKYE